MDGTNVVALKRKNRQEVFEGILKSYREKIVRLIANENIQVLKLKEANIFDITLQKNVVNISFDELPESDYSYSCTLVIRQDSIGNRKVVFPENVYWSFGEVAVLSPKPKYADVVTLITFDGGETYYASHALANLGR